MKNVNGHVYRRKQRESLVHTDTGPGHLQINMSAELQNCDDAFAIIQDYSTLNKLSIFVGEDDPGSCAACISAQVDYRNGLIYPSYTAAVFAREVDTAMDYGNNLTGTLTWVFEYGDHPYFDIFRVLATNKIDKPIWNIFRMVGKMQAERLAANSTGAVSARVCRRRQCQGPLSPWRPGLHF